jgi:hypothetical protein
MSGAIPRSVWLCALAVLLAPAARAHACGVSGPDGVWSCGLDEEDEVLRPRWQLGAAYGYVSTALRFGDSVRAEQTRNALVATAGYAPTRQLALQLSAGVAFAGELRAPERSFEFSPGPTFAAGATYRVLDGPPFIALSALLSAAFASTSPGGAGYQAFDLRVGAVIGFTLWNVLSPYAVARVFGGPVFWRYQGRALTGTDVHHYQVGAGASLSIAKQLQLYVEGVPLGERSLAGGLALLF